MRVLASLTSLAGVLFRRARMARDVDDELRSHVQHRADDLQRDGMGRADAERQARMEFGAQGTYTEAVHRAAGGHLLRTFLRELGYAARTLRKAPGFSTAAIATLALGIGAVTSVFSVVNAVLLKPFSFRDPGRLVVVRETENEVRRERADIPDNYRHYLRLKKDAKTLEDTALFQDWSSSVSPDGDHPRIVSGISASPSLLKVLGVQPILGRNFVDEDARKGADNVVMLTHAGRQSFFPGDPNPVGKTLRVGGQAETVIGVLGPGVRFPEIALGDKIVAPTGAEPQQVLLLNPFVPSERDLTNETGNFNYKVVARLKSGVTVAQASAELDALQRNYSASAHLPIHLGIAIAPLAKDVTSGISGALWLMFAAVGGVLLIGCVNLANLQLARAVSTERETAVRAALGASASQLMLARLSESLLLALVGGAAGVALAFAGVKFLVALVPAGVPRVDEVSVDLPVLVFAAVLSVTAAILFGILPALRSLRVNPQAALQSNSSRTVNSQEGRRTRSLLVAAQVACTVVLLIVTSLLLRSLSNLLGQNRGFDSGHVTLAKVCLYSPRYDDQKPGFKEAKLAYVDRALRELAQLPGVESATVTSSMPMAGENWVDELTRPDRPLPEAQRPLINVRWVNHDYLPTLRMPLVAGRNLTAADRANPNVVLISEKTEHEGFPGESAVGRKMILSLPEGDREVTIVGIVADTRINGLRDSSAMVYAPYWDYTPWTLMFLVRSPQTGGLLESEMRRVLWGIDPTIAIPVVKRMDDQVSDSVATERFQAMILTGFGAAALLLALLGIYGVLAYSVSLRHREFGIRIALGSGKRALMRLVLLQAAYPVVLGASAGLAMAFLALRWLRGLLFEAPKLDPVPVAWSLLLLLAAAGLAALLPAGRAARIDPVRAIRNE
jgi:predicted permease